MLFALTYPDGVGGSLGKPRLGRDSDGEFLDPLLYAQACSLFYLASAAHAAPRLSGR